MIFIIDFIEDLDTIDFYGVIAILLINILLWRQNTKHWFFYVFSIIVIGIILPDWSCSREVQREVAKHGGTLDSFNLWYTLFVFLKYWLLLLVQIIYLALKPRIERKEKTTENTFVLDDSL